MDRPGHSLGLMGRGGSGMSPGSPGGVLDGWGKGLPTSAGPWEDRGPSWIW